MTALAVLPVPDARPPVPGFFVPSPRAIYPLERHRQPHIDYGACVNCGRSVYIVAGGAERHTDTDDFPCPGHMGFATLYDVVDVETQIEQLEEKHADDLVAECEQAEQVGRDAGFEDGKSEGLDEGHEAGRKEMHAEIDEALTGVDFQGLSLTDDQRTGVYAALADAWNHIVP